MDTLASLSEKITAAELAQKAWARVSLNDRIKLVMRTEELIHAKKNEFVELLIKTILKPKIYAVDEVDRTLDMIIAFCEAARNLKHEVLESGGYLGFKNNKTAIVGRQPLGTVLCISPFNYPLNESMNKIIPALLMGNAVLFKPASVGFEVGELIEKCFQEAKFPDDIFNLINIKSSNQSQFSDFSFQFSDKSSSVVSQSVQKETDKPTTDKPNSDNRQPKTENRELLDFVVGHPLIDCINFTGSTATAEHITRLCGIKKLIFGLSGKDASLVCSDADLALASREIVAGAFSYSGQRCTGIKKVLVAEKIYDEFIKNLKSEISNSLIAGDLHDEKTNFGPVISVKQAEYIQELIADAINLGAKVVPLQTTNLPRRPPRPDFGETGVKAGYRLLTKQWGSQFVLPTIIENVEDNMRLAWEEPFGPILPVIKFKNIDDAIKICNKSSFGLQNSVFTRDINQAFKVASELVCGVVNINGKDARGPDNFPFLGVKKSGLGVVGGIKYLLEEMSALKSLVINKTA